MSDESSHAELPLEEQLVAYLDGELDAEAGRRIEELLASDPELRKTLQQLDRTWELLGELDEPSVADGFTQTTLEMVTVAAAEDLERTRAASGGRRRRWVLTGGGLLAAGLVGFLAVWLSRPDPNQQLVQELPVLEHLDEYRLVLDQLGEHRLADDAEFLRMLDREGLFAEEDGDGQ